MKYIDSLNRSLDNDYNSDIGFHIKTDYNSLKHIYRLFAILENRVIDLGGYISRLQKFKLSHKEFPYYIFTNDKTYSIKDLYPNNKGYKFSISLDSNQPSILFEFVKVPREYRLNSKVRSISGYHIGLTNYSKFNLISYWNGCYTETWSFIKVYILLLSLLHYLDSILNSVTIHYTDRFNIIHTSMEDLISNFSSNKKIKRLFKSTNKDSDIYFSKDEKDLLKYYSKLIYSKSIYC